MQRLLVSVRGPLETLEAARGGAHILDAEYPKSALGTPYPLNIIAIREKLDQNGHSDKPISTNIGEEQLRFSTACQAALGVATAGANYIKCGIAGLDLDSSKYLGDMIVRTVRKWYPKKKIYPAVFPEEDFQISFDPLSDGPKLVKEIDCDGLLIDTYNKASGQGIIDYYDIKQITNFVKDLHDLGKEAWIAGSISIEQLPDIWKTGIDVVCVRSAACETLDGAGRFGRIKEHIVQKLVETIP